MSTIEIKTWDQWHDWFYTLPPLSRRIIQTKAVEEALVDWPEEQGFGSSDRAHATYSFCLELGTEGVEREFADMLTLERRLVEQNFDFEAGAQMFAPAQD